MYYSDHEGYTMRTHNPEIEMGEHNNNADYTGNINGDTNQAFKGDVVGTMNLYLYVHWILDFK